MSTSAYLLNRCRTKKLGNIIHKESWSRLKKSMSHVKVFGSVAYRHVPDQLRKKLDDKEEQIIHVGITLRVATNSMMMSRKES